jgi:hypothetical protein
MVCEYVGGPRHGARRPQDVADTIDLYYGGWQHWTLGEMDRALLQGPPPDGSYHRLGERKDGTPLYWWEEQYADAVAIHNRHGTDGLLLLIDLSASVGFDAAIAAIRRLLR